MNSWGKKSFRIYDTLDTRLQDIMDELLVLMNVSLISGYRGRAEQTSYYENGVSKVQYPNSKHNVEPSLAVDLQPYPMPRTDNDLRAALGYMAGLAIMIAANRGHTLRWGGDWNRNGDVTDNGFDDLFHLELVV